MSDDTNASAVSGGNGAPPASAAAPAVNAPAAAPAAGGKWYEPLGFDTETVGWMENRGLTAMDATEATKNAINGFRNAEKFLGVPKDQLLRIPDFTKAGEAELGEFWGKLGRPTDAKEYGLKPLEGQPADYAEHMATAMHKAGVPKSMAAALDRANTEYLQRMGEAAQAAKVDANKAQVENLRKEWGEAHDAQLGLAKNAAAELGVNEAHLDALQDVLGYDGTMKLFASIGEKFSEPAFHDGQGGGTDKGPMTPAKAQARIKELQIDPDWTAKYLGGNAEARAEMDRLMRAAYPG
jgi:hypothetical protein